MQPNTERERKKSKLKRDKVCRLICNLLEKGRERNQERGNRETERQRNKEKKERERRNGRRERESVCNRWDRVHSLMARHEASATRLLC